MLDVPRYPDAYGVESMQRYRNWSGTSGIRAYETGEDFIRIEYLRGGSYLYTSEAVGKEHIEAMKRLATKGSHLNTYINRHPEIREHFVKAG